MNWDPASIWVDQLSVGGVWGWHLPDTLQPDASCDGQNGSESFGTNCTGSEMGSLFYAALGNPAGYLGNAGPFSNAQSINYWSATVFAPPNTTLAWGFDMGDSTQFGYNKGQFFYSWPVKSGDVGAVPVPTAVWLFGSGLLGLTGVARRKSANI